jgi:hypothetical protein
MRRVIWRLEVKYDIQKLEIHAEIAVSKGVVAQQEDCDVRFLFYIVPCDKRSTCQDDPATSVL